MLPGELSAEALLQEAQERLRVERSKEFDTAVTAYVEEVRRHYDIPAMNRVVAIEPWGRSGSILLASYFDGHSDVMMLPALRSNLIYTFFDAYPALSLRHKLIGYPLYDERHDPHSEAAGCGRSLFEGPFAIDRGRYLAATEAICEVYAGLPAEFASSRKGFFLAVHTVFSLAAGRRPASINPLIVCAQHEWNNSRANQLVEDFPDARFIHTVRDPISSFDRLFAWFFDPDLLPDRQPPKARAVPGEDPRPVRYVSVLAPWMVLLLMFDSDRPHPGMESRASAVRFEDLHARIEATMRNLAALLGLPYEPTLVESTFNGIPYVVTRDGQSWSGPRRAKVERQMRNLSPVDRAVFFALFREDFLAWNYPYPKIFDSRAVRLTAAVLGAFTPTKMEWIVAKAAWRRRIWPWLKRGRIAIPLDTLARLAFCRLAVLTLVLREVPRRILGRNPTLRLNLPE